MASLDGLTSGISTTITFTNADGTQKWAILESFQSKPDAPTIKKVDINGKPRHAILPQGWSGTATMQRGSAALDSYWAAFERNYRLGGDQVDVTITQTIKDPDGTTSQWQYVDCAVVLEDAGTYSGTDIVMQSISFQCAAKQQLA